MTGESKFRGVIGDYDKGKRRQVSGREREEMEREIHYMMQRFSLSRYQRMC